MQKTWYEELIAKGKAIRKLRLDLAWSVPYFAQVERTIGGEIITYKPIEISKN